MTHCALLRFTSLALALAASAVLAASEAPRPNLIIINIDDLGYAETGAYGSTNRTPHIDRMAKEGRRLTSHYAAPVCSPSRASLMTGSYAKRALPIPHVLFPAAEVGLNPAERTIAEVLKDAGYATACVGKWHLGDQREFLPTRQGFDSYFGLPYSNDMGPAAEGVKSNRGAPLPTLKQKTTAKKAPTREELETGIRSSQPPLPLLENETVIGRVRAADQLELTRRYTERAVEFIRERRDRPFFLYLAHSAVHFPLYPRDEFMGRSGRGLLGDWVQEVDWSVGEVLGAVRDRGLAERTLVIFTSDNGGPLNQGATNTPLRGGKSTTFEGGMRVCTIAWWPGQIPAGTSTAAITAMMDVLPTFARLAGGRTPSDRKIDGVDIWPVLVGDPAQPPRNEMLYYRGLTLEAVRSGPWKLHLARGELYNVVTDLGEANNVAAQQPDVVRRLRAIAAATKGDLDPDGVGPGCRPVGRTTNPQPLLAYDGTVRADAVGKVKTFP